MMDWSTALATAFVATVLTAVGAICVAILVAACMTNSYFGFSLIGFGGVWLIFVACFRNGWLE